MDKIKTMPNLRQTRTSIVQQMKTIAAIFSFSLVLVAPVASAERVAIDQVIAVVNTEALMQSELDSKLDAVYQNLKQRNIQAPPKEVVREQVLDRLVLDTIQMQMAAQAGMQVTDAQLSQAISNVAQQNKLTVEQFRQVLEQQGISFANVQEQISRELLISQLRQRRVGERIKISEQEIDSFISQEKSILNTTDFHLQQMTFGIADKATPQQVAEAEQAAQKAYQQLLNGEDFSQLAIRRSNDDFALQGGDMGWRRGSELPLFIADQVLSMSINDLTLPLRSPAGFHIFKLVEKRGGPSKLVNETLARHILIAPTALRTDAEAKQLINELRARIQAGEDFAQLAQAYSDDKGSASEGGLLGWAPGGQFVPAFDAAMNTTSINGISPAFRSNFGWHIVRVEGRRTQDIGAQVLRDQARQQLFKRKFDTELDNWLREIKASAYIDIR